MEPHRISPDIDRLQMVLQHHKMSRVKFREEFGLTSQNWNNWRLRGIPKNKLRVIADYFDISDRWLENGGQRGEPDWLDTNNPGIENDYDEIKIQKVQGKSTKLPLITLSEAAECCIKQNYDVFNSAEKWPSTSEKVSKKAYIVTMPDDSMINPNGYPSIPKGALVVVDPQKKPGNDDIVVVCWPNIEHAVLKKLVILGPQKLLVSLNPEYPNQSMNEDSIICGVAITVKQKLV